jgi:hypothetical protein
MNESGEPDVPTATPAAPQLQYAPAPPGSRRFKNQRVMAGVVVLLALLFCVINRTVVSQWWTDWKAHKQRLTLQSVCENWALPAGTVIIEPDHDKGSALFGGGGYHYSFTRAAPGLNNYVYRPEPALAEWASSLPQFAGTYTAAYSPNTPTIFVHKLINHAGQARIVTLHFEAGETATFPVAVWQPESRWGRPFSLIGRPVTKPGFRVSKNAARSMRIFAGVVDPSDRSKFSFDYEIGDVRGTMHGQLADDDTVSLTPSGGSITEMRVQPNGNHVFKFNEWDPTSQPALQQAK